MLLALSLYPPTARQILRREMEQNLATFILWGTLDAVVAVSIMFQHGNWYLPAAYVLGCMVVITALIIVKTYSWTWFETAIAIMVVACIVGWKISGPRMATIMSTTGVVLAGLPQLLDAYRKPATKPMIIYSLFTLANVLSVMGGKAWTVEERLYPSACSILCLMVTMAYGRKLFSRPSESGVLLH